MTQDPVSSYPETEAIRHDNGEKYVFTKKTPVDWGERKVHLTRLQNLGSIDPHSKVRVSYFSNRSYIYLLLHLLLCIKYKK